MVRLSFMNRARVAPGPRIGVAPAGGAFGGAGVAAGAPPLPSTAAMTSSLVTLAAAAGALHASEVDAVRVGDPDRDRGRVRAAVAGSPAASPEGSDPLSRATLKGSDPLSAPGSMRATIVPDWTVSSGSARISATTPATGDGISASTLSVEISTSVSPSATSSPTCLCHSSTVPSWTDSPICGSTTSTSPAGAAFSAWFLAATCAISVALGSLRSAPLSSPRWSRSADASPPPRSPGRRRPCRSRRARFRPAPSRRPRRGSGRACPAAGAGTSASTLSVETSSSVSSGSTWSPTCLCHSSTVPSVTESPIWGMVICTVVPASI